MGIGHGFLLTAKGAKHTKEMPSWQVAAPIEELTSNDLEIQPAPPICGHE
jgi:hypothetical protein